MFQYKDSEVRGVTLELPHEPEEDDIRAVRVGDTIHVVYLMHDGSGYDPLEGCDGVGTLETYAYRRELGLDCYGNPNFEGEYELIRALMYGDLEIDGEQYLEIEAAALSMWEKKAAQNLVGTPYAEPLRKGYHGELRSCEREEAELAWVPDKYYLEHINSFPENERLAKHAEAFEGVIAEYNKWATGDVWGIVQASFDMSTQMQIGEHDACWGFIGKEYAEEERDGMIKIFTERENKCCTT